MFVSKWSRSFAVRSTTIDHVRIAQRTLSSGNAADSPAGADAASADSADPAHHHSASGLQLARPSPFTYHITRTPSNNLPVYKRLKGHGDRKRVDVVIRRCHGDVVSLKQDLTTWLAPLPTDGTAESTPSESQGLSTSDLAARKRFKGHGRARSVSIDTRTGHVILNGYAKHQIVKILEQQGF